MVMVKPFSKAVIVRNNKYQDSIQKLASNSMNIDVQQFIITRHIFHIITFIFVSCLLLDTLRNMIYLIFPERYTTFNEDLHNGNT